MADAESQIVEVAFTDRSGNHVARLSLAPSSRQNPSPLRVIPDSEACEYGEERIQIFESGKYAYRIDFDFGQVREIPGVVQRSVFSQGGVETGVIEPGLNLGKLKLILEDRTGEILASAFLEVVPFKLGYRNDFRAMLEDISRWSVDLILRFAAPSELNLNASRPKESASLIQRFYIIKGVVESEELFEAIVAVVSAPHVRLIDEPESIGVAELDPDLDVDLFSFATSTPRIALRNGQRMAELQRSRGIDVPTAPESVDVYRQVESVDVAENQFVKFVLESFIAFLDELSRDLISANEQSADFVAREVAPVVSSLSELRADPFFNGISEPMRIELNSPVLFRKRGYRELLSIWQRFDIAASVSWEGGEDVFRGGSRDVAKLYEYWLFFLILDLLMKHHLRIDDEADVIHSLFERHPNSFSLKLRSGVALNIVGIVRDRWRCRYSYNRTFSAFPFFEIDGRLKHKSNYPASGTWTRDMIPDFTLSFWPVAFSESEAEQLEKVVHVHFDAKYSVSALNDLFGGDAVSEQQVNRQTYSRRDLLKMHTYRDAIRRTQGAYILYPGVAQSQVGSRYYSWVGFHEVLPGLGAFTVRPGAHDQLGTETLSAFLDDLIDTIDREDSFISTLSSAIYDFHTSD